MSCRGSVVGVLIEGEAMGAIVEEDESGGRWIFW